MSNEHTLVQFEIQSFDQYYEEWKVQDVCFSEEEAMKRAESFAIVKGEVRVVKREETVTILGTMKRKDKHDQHT